MVEKVVIDTNVLLVANQQHSDVSPECVSECVLRLQKVQGGKYVVVVDDGYRVVGEYQNKTSIHPPKGVGDVFLKWLLRNLHQSKYVEQVGITELEPNVFDEFPGEALQLRFDAPDRKFAAVANAHACRPAIWQAADCKWLDWWSELAAAGVRVEFLCPADACRFYRKKFPGQPSPDLP